MPRLMAVSISLCCMVSGFSEFLNKETNNDTSTLYKPHNDILEFVKEARDKFNYKVDLWLFQSMICSFKSEPIMGLLEFVVRENYKNVMEWRIINGK